MNVPWFIVVLFSPLLFIDWIMDVDYKWWRKWIGEEPRRVGDKPDGE